MELASKGNLSQLIKVTHVSGAFLIEVPHLRFEQQNLLLL